MELIKKLFPVSSQNLKFLKVYGGLKFKLEVLNIFKKDRERQRETERDRDRERQRETERERGREKRETERESLQNF